MGLMYMMEAYVCSNNIAYAACFHDIQHIELVAT